MKITVEAHKPMFSKKTVYIASFGSFKEQGATKEEARAKLSESLEWYFSEIENHLTCKAIPESGVTLYLLRTFEGYEVRTVYHDGRYSTGSSHYGRLTHREALKRLESHAEGYMSVKVV